jgi:carbon storage regulator CsrA
MLALSRHANESIMVGDDLEIRVVEVTPAAVRLRSERRADGGRLVRDLFDGTLGVGESIDSLSLVLGGLRCIVLEVRNEKVLLGIVAPMNVSVHRREVWEAIQIERGDDYDFGS